MNRDTPKIRNIYSELRDLIQELDNMEALSSNLEPGLLTEFVILTATTRVDNDGDNQTTVGYLQSYDQAMPHFRILGLIDFVRIRIQKEIAED